MKAKYGMRLNFKVSIGEEGGSHEVIKAKKIGRLFVHPTVFTISTTASAFTVSNRYGLAVYRCHGLAKAEEAARRLSKLGAWAFKKTFKAGSAIHEKWRNRRIQALSGLEETFIPADKEKA